MTALHIASCVIESEKIVRFLIKKGIDINAVDNSKKTALQYAESNNSSDISSILISNGAKRNKKHNISSIFILLLFLISLCYTIALYFDYIN